MYYSGVVKLYSARGHRRGQCTRSSPLRCGPLLRSVGPLPLTCVRTYARSRFRAFALAPIHFGLQVRLSFASRSKRPYRFAEVICYVRCGNISRAQDGQPLQVGALCTPLVPPDCPFVPLCTPLYPTLPTVLLVPHIRRGSTSCRLPAPPEHRHVHKRNSVLRAPATVPRT